KPCKWVPSSAPHEPTCRGDRRSRSRTSPEARRRWSPATRSTSPSARTTRACRITTPPANWPAAPPDPVAPDHVAPDPWSGDQRRNPAASDIPLQLIPPHLLVLDHTLHQLAH